MKTKLFKVTSDTKVLGCSKYCDWYEANDSAAALELAKEDAHRYGLPENTEFAVIECNPTTLKPV